MKSSNEIRPTRRVFLTSVAAAGAISFLPRVGLASQNEATSKTLAFDGDNLLSAGRGLAVSGDDGRSWIELASPGRILALATHRDQPGLVVAGLAEGGVARSRDGGKTWQSGRGGLPAGEVGAIASAARNPDLLYAAIRGDGLWKSEDAGKNWSLAMDRPWLNEAERDPLTLVSVDLETGMGGIWIYAGTDVGLTRVPDCFCRWQEVLPGNAMDALVTGSASPPEAPLPLGEPVLSLASAPSAPERLFAALPSGIWASEDGGVVWRRMIEGTASVVAVHPGDEQHIAAVIGSTLNLSRDGGATWHARAAG